LSRLVMEVFSMFSSRPGEEKEKDSGFETPRIPIRLDSLPMQTGFEPEPRLKQLLVGEQIAASSLEGLDSQGQRCDQVRLCDTTLSLIGSGSFGEVHKVSWRKTPCAAKIPYSDLAPNVKELALRELELMVRCRHPNIVQFLGYVDQPFIIVMEYMPTGDLRNHWMTRKLSVAQKTRICIDILRGIAYLHDRQPPIVHRDIKPSNVLLSRSGKAKLTDFGLSRTYASSISPTPTPGPSVHGGRLFPTPSPSVHGGRLFFQTPLQPKARERRRSKESLNHYAPPELTLAESHHQSTAARPTDKAAAEATLPTKLTSKAGRERHAELPQSLLHKMSLSTDVGTVPYMAPEANGTQGYDLKVDIYSAGCTFCELYEEASLPRDRPPTAAGGSVLLWAVTPSKLRPIMEKMTSTDPKQRPSALELIKRFEESNLGAEGAGGCCVVS